MARHKHNWAVREKNILPSAFQQASAEGVKITRVEYAGVGKDNLFYNPAIVHYACECGAEKVERV